MEPPQHRLDRMFPLPKLPQEDYESRVHPEVTRGVVPRQLYCRSGVCLLHRMISLRATVKNTNFPGNGGEVHNRCATSCRTCAMVKYIQTGVCPVEHDLSRSASQFLGVFDVARQFV